MNRTLLLLSALALAACAPNDKPLKTQMISAAESAPAASPAAAPSAPDVQMTSDQLAEKNIRAALAEAAPQVKVDAVRPSSLKGMYEVKVKGYGPSYVSADGKYMLQGELFRIDGKELVSETEQVLTEERKQALAAVPLKDMLIYPAKGQRKAAVYVFTDVDCGYCRKLHSEINEINALGIEVRYLAFPRAGYPSPSASKLEAVWCNANPLQALTLSKQGQNVVSPACANPVKAQYELGAQVGVHGTPAIFTESGAQVGGYLPPKSLADELGIK